MAEYSYSYKIPVGPVHPGLKEPIHLSFEIEGEEVVNLDIKTGWVHRGIEYLGLQRNPIQVIYLAERICGICSVCHAFCFARAVESAAGIEVPLRAEYIRTIIAELERIHSHILWAGVAAHLMGFDSLFYYTWRVREEVMDVLEYLTGNRVNYGILAIGGVRRDITTDGAAKIRENLESYLGLFNRLVEAFVEDPSVRARTRDIGVLTREEAIETCAVGPTARASGVATDVRQDQPYCAYADLEVKAITPEAITGETRGDVFDKAVVRLFEIAQSIEIIEKCLEGLPEGKISAEDKLPRLLNQLKKASGEGISSIEAPRGEDYHYVRLEEGEANVTAWKVRAPTYANIPSWFPMMKGAQIADIPLIVASIDPCISCTDRVTVVDRKKGTTTVLTEEDLRRLCVEKTRRMLR